MTEENFIWKIEFVDVDRAIVYCKDPDLRDVIVSYLEDIGSWMWKVYHDFKNSENIKIEKNKKGLFVFTRVR
jgi:hypothetical protein